MNYKVITVSAGCCKPVEVEMEKTANQMASQGFVLVICYGESLNCCNNVSSPGCQRGAVMVFAQPR